MLLEGGFDLVKSRSCRSALASIHIAVRVTAQARTPGNTETAPGADSAGYRERQPRKTWTVGNRCIPRKLTGHLSLPVLREIST